MAEPSKLRSLEVVQRMSHTVLEDKTIEFMERKKNSLQARCVYAFLFFLTNLLAWLIRDYGHKVQIGLRNIKVCGDNGNDCLHAGGVLRVSLGCFIFFVSMTATTFKAHKLYGVRHSWHSSRWAWKFMLFLTAMLVPFTLPLAIIQIYGEVARVGAGIFLLLQLLSLIHFLKWCDNHWMPEAQSNHCGFLGLFFSTIFCSAAFCGLLLLYFIYSPKGSCILNLFFIIWTTILVKLMLAISLHAKINRGLLSSSIMGAYTVFLCWSAIHSEPINMRCNAQHKLTGNADLATILSFLIAICTIVTATFSTGLDSQSFQCHNEEDLSEDNIPYKYDFFHFVFSMGAMYFGMLFISWKLDYPTQKWSIDVGWASTSVKIINQWLAASIYLWQLVSPVVAKSRAADRREPDLRIHDSV